jgi:hypothetical protein
MARERLIHSNETLVGGSPTGVRLFSAERRVTSSPDRDHLASRSLI